MLLLRLIGTLTAIAIGAGIVAFLFTGERRYLGLAWRIAKYALVVTFVILALFFFERMVAFV